METTAPDVTVSTTIGEVVIESPAPTPTLSPAGPPIPPPYYFFPTIPPALFPREPADELVPKRYFGRPLIIYGYGPANSKVSLNGIGVSGNTTSDTEGFFRFEEIYSYTFTYPELCIQAIDSENRVTQPSCIPALPPLNSIPSEVGPIMLSPTISLNSNNILMGDPPNGEARDVVASGFTIPNSKLDIHIAREEGRRTFLVKTAHAYNIPIYKIESDEKGKFEFSLPTQTAVSYKIFATSTVGESYSAKSTTLTFSVLSGAQSFWNFLISIFLNNKLLFVIILEVIIIVYLIWAILKGKSYKFVTNS